MGAQKRYKFFPAVADMNNWFFHRLQGILRGMSLFKKKNEPRGFFHSIEKVLHHLGFFKKASFFEKHAIQFLNISQFLGVVNDNFFKYLIVFLFIDLKGIEASPIILTWVGIVYVLPFLLFSSGAGILTDRFSKQKMIVLLKLSEVVIMSLGVVAFSFHSDWACYTLLFFLSIQSALFGPPKYSIIPELVKQEHISKANGLITSSTYLGVITGTFLASFLTQVTGRNFPVSAGVATFLAILGFIASIFIPATEPKRFKKKMHPLFIYEIYKNLKYASQTPKLLIAIFGSASFLFIGSYFQLNIIPFAVQSLDCSEVAGGYLFLLTAIGIASGALFAGKISQHRTELGMACFAGILLSTLLFSLSLLFEFYSFILCALVLMGFCGGLYIVPFDSFVQKHAPEKTRGQIVAAGNFLSFCGVLIAPLLLYFLSEVLHLKARTGFLIVSIIILSLVLKITSKLSGYFSNYIARLCVSPFYNVELHHSPFERSKPLLLVLEKFNRLHIILLATLSSNVHFYVPRMKKKRIARLLKTFLGIDYIYVKNRKESVISSFLKRICPKKQEFSCLLFPGPHLLEDNFSNKDLRELKKIQDFDIVYMSVQEIPRSYLLHRKFFKRTKLIVSFEHK